MPDPRSRRVRLVDRRRGGRRQPLRQHDRWIQLLVRQVLGGGGARPLLQALAAQLGANSMIGPFAIGRVHRVEALASLREMPDESVYAIVADPPYSSGGFTRGDRVLHAPERKYVENEERAVPHASFAGDNRDARSWAAWMTLWLDEAHRLTRVGGRCYVFADWPQLPAATDAIQAGGGGLGGIVGGDKTEGSRAPHTGYHRHQTHP